MNKVANTYWINARLAAQNSSRASAATFDLTAARPRANANVVDAATRRRAGRLVSPFGVLAMVIVTMFALCFSVTMRTQAEVRTANAQYETVNAEVEALRDTNTELKRQVERLQSDPRAIEDAARERLGMVRPNDIIVPVK